MMPDDFKEINQFILENDFCILPETSKDNSFKEFNSLIQIQNGKNYLSKTYITRNQDKNKLITIFSEVNKEYYINEMDSPVVEFWYPGLLKQSSQKHRGRFYYIKNIYNEKLQSIDKNEEFLKFASGFFKWIKKHFKYTKLKDFENFLVSEKTVEWMKNTNGILLLNNVEDEKIEEKSILLKASKK